MKQPVKVKSFAQGGISPESSKVPFKNLFFKIFSLMAYANETNQA